MQTTENFPETGKVLFTLLTRLGLDFAVEKI
jgi:hypothetical protein